MAPAQIAASELVQVIRESLAAQANSERAAGQQAYMRSHLPYHGLAMPEVRTTMASLGRQYRLPDAGAWQQAIRELWDGATHREQWYAALALARRRAYEPWARDLAAVELWEHLIRTGAWWDVNDEIAQHLIELMLAAHHIEMTAILRTWSTDADLWIRRVAILAQNGRRAGTDPDLLADCIAGSLADRDFFSRKAIGWALREYSKTDPVWVQAYVARHSDALSPLSTREALRLIR
jgi:3-methyladenine DNA glycosylase AlkD